MSRHGLQKPSCVMCVTTTFRKKSSKLFKIQKASSQVKICEKKPMPLLLYYLFRWGFWKKTCNQRKHWLNTGRKNVINVK